MCPHQLFNTTDNALRKGPNYLAVNVTLNIHHHDTVSLRLLMVSCCKESWKDVAPGLSCREMQQLFHLM